MRSGCGRLVAGDSNARYSRRDAEHAPLRAPRIAAVVLAAGLSSRIRVRTSCWPIGAASLCCDWTVEAAFSSDAKPVIVVTGA